MIKIKLSTRPQNVVIVWISWSNLIYLEFVSLRSLTMLCFLLVIFYGKTTLKFIIKLLFWLSLIIRENSILFSLNYSCWHHCPRPIETVVEVVRSFKLKFLGASRVLILPYFFKSNLAQRKLLSSQFETIMASCFCFHYVSALRETRVSVSNPNTGRVPAGGERPTAAASITIQPEVTSHNNL